MERLWPFASPGKVFPDGPLSNSSPLRLSRWPDCEGVPPVVLRASRVALPELECVPAVAWCTTYAPTHKSDSVAVVDKVDRVVRAPLSRMLGKAPAKMARKAVGMRLPPKMQDRGSTDTRSMLRRARHLLHWMMDRHCPFCSSIEVRPAQRRNLMEVVLLPFLLARPFRCESCRRRFYSLAFRRRVPAPHDAKPMSDLPQDLPVLVYGRRKDEEPFQEETNVRVLNLRAGLITLATKVEPGQQLILINVATEEDQRCRVAFVGELRLGRSMIGLHFSQLAQEFCHIDDPAHRKSNACSAGAFREQ